MVDLDPHTMENVRSSPVGHLFRPENCVWGREGASNNWARGRYTDGNGILEPVLDVIRHEVENCDHVQGFQLVHSMGGGMGSGFGCLLLEHIRDEWSNKITNTFSIFPSPKVRLFIIFLR